MEKGNEKKSYEYAEVWGDTVDIKELAYSCIIGVVVTMGAFLLGQKIFQSMDIEASLVDGYALLVGIVGCLVSGAICAVLFKPKRVVQEKVGIDDIEEILNDAGITIEEEAEALGKSDPSIIKELEDLQLYALLALIPKDSPNYKAEYKEKAGGNKS